MPVLQTGLAKSGAEAYTIDQSLRFDDGDSAYLSRTPGSAGNQQVFTVSAWVKLGSAAADNKSIALMAEYTDDNNRGYITFGSYCRVFSRGSGSDIANYSTDATFRDPSAWYHVVFSIDVTQSTAGDRVKIYVNGVQQDISISSNWPEDTDTRYNASGREYHIGKLGGGAGIVYADGYIAEMHFIDGTALTPASFGQTDSATNQWKPIEYTGSYGTNGFYLDFADSAALGDDESGNSNDFTVTNLVATDQMLDSPTNNFCTLNPLDVTSSGGTYSEGNLKFAQTSGATGRGVSTFRPNSGKWYGEFYVVDATRFSCGVMNKNNQNSMQGGGSTDSAIFLYNKDAYYNSSTVSDYLTSTLSNGDIISFALDLDNTILWYGINGTWQQSATEGEIEAGTSTNSFTTFISSTNPISSDVGIFIEDNSSGGAMSGVANFGQDSSFAGNVTAQGNQDSNGIGDFYYEPPANFLALCSSNLASPEIALPTGHFNSILWTGDSGGRAFTGVGFQPDFVWAKNRDDTWGYTLVDSVRGGNEVLSSDVSDAEVTNNNNGWIDSFDSDGFTVIAGASNANWWNNSGDDFVGWNWKAGGAAVSNTDGTITSSVSANTTAGFSIVSYEGNSTSGATIGHGLSSAPELVICKERETAGYDWLCYAEPIGATKNIRLNLSNAAATSTGFWNDTAPSASVFTVGNNGDVNISGKDIIAYCFHSVEGYSKVGSYVGNGDADGPFIYTGFRPAFFLWKNTEYSGTDWGIIDNQREGYNVDNDPLYASTSAAEYTTDVADILSNGIKVRHDLGNMNESNDVIIFMAFAESPFKTSNAR